MADLPEPPVPADADLRDFLFTPIFRARLFGSSFHAHANDSEWRAGVTLWLKSWDQMPAGSLPDDDIELCRLAELGRDLKRWRKIKSRALHGWYRCADGRLYHKVVAEQINQALTRKQAQREKTLRARIAALQKRLAAATDSDSIARMTAEIDRLSQGLSQGLSQKARPSVTESVTDSVTESKGQGQGQGQGIDIYLSHTHTRARAREKTDGAAVIDCGANLTLTSADLNGSGLDAWRQVDGINADAFARWIIHVECSGKPMTAAMRIGQAKRLAGQGSAAEQAEVVEFCIAQGYRSLIPLVDVRARTQGLTRAATATPARTYRRAPTTEELEAREAAHAGK